MTLTGSNALYDVEIEGIEESIVLLNEIASRGADIRPAVEGVSRIFREGEADIFNQSGPGWSQLSQHREEAKRRNNLDNRILRATGALYDSLVNSQVDMSIQDPDTLRLGTDIFYAIFHQFGTIHMEARPPVDIDDDDLEEMAQVIANFIVEAEE